MKIFVYFIRVGLSLSILLNVILGGPSNQTFSARNWQWKKTGKHHIVPVIDGLFTGAAKLVNLLFSIFGVRLIIENVENHCMECWVWWHVHTNKTQPYENLIDRMELKHGEEKGWKV